MAAAAALTGKLTDVRSLQGSRRYSTSARRGLSTSAGAGMQPFIQHKGLAAPMPIPNIDTDMIIPALYLKTIKRSGLGVHLFAEVRMRYASV